jgi:carboxyl-terminal processing protease
MIMKLARRILAVGAILLLGVEVQGQIKSDLKCILDSVIVNARRTSLNANAVLWDSVQLTMYQKARLAKTLQDLEESFEFLLLALNDSQAKIFNPVSNTAIASYPKLEDTELPTLENIENDINAKFDFAILKGGIRYLKITSIYSTDIQAEAAKIRNAIDSLSKDDSHQWIVDLRYCHGGNMNPVIAGIGPLLGEGLIGGLVDRKHKIKKLYEIHNGKFYDDKHLVVEFPTTKDMMHTKIAVLTSKYTSGAGEILAMMIKGRKHTKIIGEPTAGQVTFTTNIAIKKDLVMALSECFYQDRKGIIYKENIKPEILVEFESTADYAEDKAIAEAIDWLNSIHKRHSSLTVRE